MSAAPAVPLAPASGIFLRSDDERRYFPPCPILRLWRARPVPIGPRFVRLPDGPPPKNEITARPTGRRFDDSAARGRKGDAEHARWLALLFLPRAIRIARDPKQRKATPIDWEAIDAPPYPAHTVHGGRVLPEHREEYDAWFRSPPVPRLRGDDRAALEAVSNAIKPNVIASGKAAERLWAINKIYATGHGDLVRECRDFVAWTQTIPPLPCDALDPAESLPALAALVIFELASKHTHDKYYERVIALAADEYRCPGPRCQFSTDIEVNARRAYLRADKAVRRQANFENRMQRIPDEEDAPTATRKWRKR